MSTNECFQRQLAKANDPKTLAVLATYYNDMGFELLHRPDYQSQSDQHLQQIGCDVLLGDNGSAYFGEEKIWSSGNGFFFPEFASHGKPGWAIDHHKRTEYIFCVNSTHIFGFCFNDFRQFCIEQEPYWQEKGYMRSNDNNTYAQVPTKEFLTDFNNAGYSHSSTLLRGYLQ